jgi:Galactose oxidase, central domain
MMARFIISATLFAVSAGQAFAQSAAPSWTYTGSLNTPRAGHTATLLPNGKVLVVGGSGAGVPDTADLYDPVTGTWSFTGKLKARHAVLLHNTIA